MSCTDSEEENTPPRRGKKMNNRNNNTKTTSGSSNKDKKFQQYYNDLWQNEFPWVKSSELGRTFFACKFCPKSYCCRNDGITAVKRHGATLKHKQAVEVANQTKSVMDIFKPKSNLATRAQKIEIQATLFLIQNNLPISMSGDLINLIRNLDIDESVQKMIKCERTKASAIARNVVARKSSKDLHELLRNGYFSLIIDESTDISTVKQLALCCRYSELDKIHDRFLGLLKVEDGTSAGLYTLIVDFFVKNNIPYKTKMVGFASDGASVITGHVNGVVPKLMQDIPHLFTLKCICHSLARALSYATQELPHEIEEMMSSVYCYLKFSSKRRQGLAQFQTLLDIPEHKILRVFKIRWLSLHTAVKRYIEQYDALFRYFDAERRNNIPDAEVIFQRLRNRWTLLYLQFMDFAIGFVTKKNMEFQSEEPKIYKLHAKMEDLFKTVVGCYVQEDYVERTDPEFLEFAEPTPEWLPLRNINLGPHVAVGLKKLPPSISTTDIDNFRSRCRKFLIILAKEIAKRFPFAEKSVQMLKEFEFIEPMSLKMSHNVSIAADFFGFDIEDVHKEFKTLKRIFKNDFHLDKNSFWNKVRNYENADGSTEFPLVLDMVNRIAVLPHSSATVERIFSQININKTKLRNKLETETLEAILHGKALLRDTSITSVDLTDMVKMMNKSIYQ